jgi:alanine dehydrogenase
MQIHWLNAEDIQSLIDIPYVIEAVEGAFIAFGKGEAHMPSKVYLNVPKGDFRAMPAALPGIAGVKWINVHPANREHQPPLPTVMALIVINEPETGAPLAVMDGTLITRFRTGAAAAVATRALARKDAKTLGLIGCGGQSRAMLEALLCVLPQAEVMLADARREAAEHLAGLLPNIKTRIVSTQEAASADVVTTLTASRAPFVQKEWIRPGTHINAMGADAAGKQELATELTISAHIFVDDWNQASHSGEINVPVHEGRLTQEQIAGTLSDVLCGKNPGRASAGEITLFDSTGLAIQDLAVAARVYAAAVNQNKGRLLENIAIS